MGMPLPSNIVLADGPVKFCLAVPEYYVGQCSVLESFQQKTALRNMTVLTSQSRRNIFKSVLMSLLDKANY
jgi:hypothetical protein